MIKVIKFFATWCGPCKMLKPILERLQKEYGFELKEVDVSNGVPDEYKNLSITSVPTLLFYKDDVLKETTGFKNENELKNILDKIKEDK